MYRWWNLINVSRQGFGHHQLPSLLPSLIPHTARRDLLWHLISSLHKSFNGFLLHVNIHSLVLTPSATDGVPTLTPFIFAQVTRFLSVLLSAKLFPTSGFCTCYFLCLECVSFCFSHHWVFVILQISTEMPLPHHSLSWPYYLKLVSPFYSLSLYPISFITLAIICDYIICSFGYLTTILQTPWVQGWCLSCSLCVFRAQPSVWQSSYSVLFEWIISCDNIMVFLVEPWWIWLFHSLSIF